jgi:hypothetical protein
MQTIGWFINRKKPWLELLVDVPEPLNVHKKTNANYRYCPASTHFFSNTFIIKSPFDLELKWEDGEIKLVESSFTAGLFEEVVLRMPKEKWDNPQTPIFQINIDQGFVADEDTWLEATMPHMDSKSRKLPGRMIPGTFDIYSWQRHLSYSFEWMNTKENFIIKKGDPLIYIKFHSKKLHESFKIKRIQMSEELERVIERCEVVKYFYMGKSWNLMKINRRLIKNKWIK